MTATDEIQLETEPKASLAPPPRWPRTRLGAEALPPPAPRPQRPAAPTRLYLIVCLVRRPGFLRTVDGGVLFGALAAITRIGPHPFSLRGVLPVLAAGAVFGAVVSLALRSMRHHGIALSYALPAAAGAMGGTVWWLMVRPSSALLTTALFGAVLANGVIAFERRLRGAAV